MVMTRVMPCLLLKDSALVKTVRFRSPGYIGDPVNAVKIFNEKEVDELVVLDITATVRDHQPDYRTIGQIAGECFMPVAYGGGIAAVDQIRQIFALGVEKVIINSAAIADPGLIGRAAREFGSQSIVAGIDVKRDRLGRYRVAGHSVTRITGLAPVGWAQELERRGAGEILLTDADRDGTMSGFDLALIAMVAGAVSVPLIACGGAGTPSDIESAVLRGGASAVAIGSMAVYQGKNRAVLINFPTRDELSALQ